MTAVHAFKVSPAGHTVENRLQGEGQKVGKPVTGIFAIVQEGDDSYLAK